MRPDIVNLRQFYSSRLGRTVKERLATVARRYWPTHSGEVILGVGYTLPILRALERTGPGTILTLMPAAQGAIYWPIDQDNRSILADEMRPPFAPGSVSRLTMLHALEHVAKPEELLRMAWDILAPGGQLLLAVPNRHGLWARYGSTPFTQGTPYTFSALKTMLNEVGFTLRETGAALYAPPSTHPLFLQCSGLLEWLGHLFLPRGGGLIVIEAEKQIFAGVGERLQTGKWKFTPAPQAQGI